MHACYQQIIQGDFLTNPLLVPVVDVLHQRMQAGELPFLSLPSQSSDLPEIERWADKIRDSFAHLVVFGTGGSSLGGLTLTHLRQPRFGQSGTMIHFADNSDPETLQQLFTQLPIADCFFLAISKSGNTAETVAQFLLTMQYLESGGYSIADRCLVITMPGDRPLRRLADHYHIPILAHDSHLGGRFSVLSAVGLLPAAVAGLSLHGLREGAKSVMDEFWLNRENSLPARGAAFQHHLAKPVSVLMPYCDRLENFGRWYQQLWAESLGKNGKGSTPVRALGAVDQHSQLQLYLDGPRDKVITLIELSAQLEGENINAALASSIGMEYLGNQTLGSIVTAQQQATVTTLMNHGVPVRQMMLPALTEASVGALLQHFMLETVLMAGLLAVDAFDQPAVEESKQLAREWLASRA